MHRRSRPSSYISSSRTRILDTISRPQCRLGAAQRLRRTSTTTTTTRLQRYPRTCRHLRPSGSRTTCVTRQRRGVEASRPLDPMPHLGSVSALEWLPNPGRSPRLVVHPPSTKDPHRSTRTSSAATTLSRIRPLRGRVRHPHPDRTVSAARLQQRHPDSCRTRRRTRSCPRRRSVSPSSEGTLTPSARPGRALLGQ